MIALIFLFCSLAKAQNEFPINDPRNPNCPCHKYQQQAEEEYDEALLGWEAVPDDVGDAHLFAIRYANDRLNDRGGWGGDGA